MEITPQNEEKELRGRRPSFSGCQTDKIFITERLADWFSIIITKQSYFNLLKSTVGCSL